MRVLVTGGANGIGKATAIKLLEKGHRVAVFDKDWKAMKKLSREIETYEGDVADEERVKEVIEKEEFDVLVNSAGYYELGAIEDVSDETARKIYDTNVFGTLNFCRNAIPKLQDRSGRIVNISSVAGFLSMPYHGIYCGTKHSIEAITDAMRMENAGTDLDVVLVEPGPVRTGFNRRARDALEKYIGSSRYSDTYKKLVAEQVKGIKTEKAAEKVVKAVEAEKPRARYRVTWQSHLGAKLRFLPEWLKDRIKRKIIEGS